MLTGIAFQKQVRLPAGSLVNEMKVATRAAFVVLQMFIKNFMVAKTMRNGVKGLSYATYNATFATYLCYQSYIKS